MEDRGMATAAERLQFVIRFVQLDLDALRPGDWLNLRDDLMAFMLSGWTMQRVAHPPRRGTQPPSDSGVIAIPQGGVKTPPDADTKVLITALQTETRDVLRQLLDSRVSGMMVDGGVDLHARFHAMSLDV